MKKASKVKTVTEQPKEDTTIIDAFNSVKERFANLGLSAEDPLPTFSTGQTVTYQGKAAKVEEITHEGKVIHITVTDHLYVSAKDLR